MKPAVGWRKEIATNELGLRQTRRPFCAFLAFRMREWGDQRVADRRPRFDNADFPLTPGSPTG